jgi:tRNA(Phe) wybutosine-synthesizing methylase Tyw3
MISINTLAVLNLFITGSVAIGVYKNKIDTLAKMNERYRETEIKLARLEEKINFLIDKIKNYERNN